MKVLLDSLVLLWMLEDSHHLGPQARTIISEAEDVAVSSISIVEIQTKSLSGRVSLAGDLLQAIRQSGVSELLFSWDDAVASGNILSPGGDLFNALIVGQCQIENYRLLTADTMLLERFPELVLDARP